MNPTTIGIITNAICFLVLLSTAVSIFIRVHKNHFKHGISRPVLKAVGIVFATDSIVHLSEIYHITLHQAYSAAELHQFILWAPLPEAIAAMWFAWVMYRKSHQF